MPVGIFWGCRGDFNSCLVHLQLGMSRIRGVVVLRGARGFHVKTNCWPCGSSAAGLHVLSNGRSALDIRDLNFRPTSAAVALERAALIYDHELCGVVP